MESVPYVQTEDHAAVEFGITRSGNFNGKRTGTYERDKFYCRDKVGLILNSAHDDYGQVPVFLPQQGK